MRPTPPHRRVGKTIIGHPLPFLPFTSLQPWRMFSPLEGTFSLSYFHPARSFAVQDGIGKLEWQELAVL